LEGSSRNASIQGMASTFHRAGWDVLAWNLRGCGGEPNRLLRTYHSGSRDDLEWVIEHAAPAYQRIALVGFSIGGNLTLKYLGDLGSSINSRILGAVTFSVPCDLAPAPKHLSAQSTASTWSTSCAISAAKSVIRPKNSLGQFPLNA
jgi:predicted alpha/beta-fold hydrolase